MKNYLNDLLEMSRSYGADERFVVKGGGNTSLKEDGVLYVKASGHALSTIDEGGFVKMSMEALTDMWNQDYPADVDAREKLVLKAMMDARLEGETLRPSVEALLHAIIDYRFVVHLHPAMVNGLTCSQLGKEGMSSLFPDALWIGIVNPGFILAKTVRDAQNEYLKSHPQQPKIIFLQNHGVFVAADSKEEINEIYAHIMKTLDHYIVRKPNFSPVRIHSAKVKQIEEALGEDAGWIVVQNHELSTYLQDKESFYPISSAYTPDHIVYSGVAPMWVDASIFKKDNLKEELLGCFAEHERTYGQKPKVIAVQQLGLFTVNESARTLILDTVKVAVFTTSFGGPKFMEQEYIDFIRDWEVESYRSKVSS